MNYSSGHKGFATLLSRHLNINEQDVLDHSEKYLGPNYKEVLNWWFYWDSLSIEQLKVWRKRYRELDGETYYRARKTSVELAKEVINPKFIGFFGIGTLELIASHLYIERQISFTQLPQIFNL